MRMTLMHYKRGSQGVGAARRADHRQCRRQGPLYNVLEHTVMLVISIRFMLRSIAAIGIRHRLLPTQVRMELSAVDGDPSGAIRAALSAATLAQLLDLTVLPTSAPFPRSAVPTSGGAAHSI